MQRLHPLQVAVKDRPKIFQIIVFSLFSFSVFVIVACGFTRLQSTKAAQAKKGVAPNHHSFSTATMAAAAK